MNDEKAEEPSELLEEEEVHGRPDPEDAPVAIPADLTETTKKPWWKFW
jgi:hypothetical protein